MKPDVEKLNKIKTEKTCFCILRVYKIERRKKSREFNENRIEAKGPKNGSMEKKEPLKCSVIANLCVCVCVLMLSVSHLSLNVLLRVLLLLFSLIFFPCFPFVRSFDSFQIYIFSYTVYLYKIYYNMCMP